MFWALFICILVSSCFCEENQELLQRLDKAESTISFLVDELKSLKQSLNAASTSNYSLGYINAVNPPYYAVGDGVTDNTGAIQNALNAAAAMVIM